MQLKVFNKLEEGMYKQQFSVKKRLQNSPEAIALGIKKDISNSRLNTVDHSQKPPSVEREERV